MKSTWMKDFKGVMINVWDYCKDSNWNRYTVIYNDNEEIKAFELENMETKLKMRLFIKRINDLKICTSQTLKFGNIRRNKPDKPYWTQSEKKPKKK